MTFLFYSPNCLQQKTFMRSIIVIILVTVGGLIVGCDDHDVLPAPTATTIFNATSSMSHDKDTVNSAGDVIVLTARGGVADTVKAKSYGISASVKAVDSISNVIVAAQFIKTVTVTFDTVNMSTTKLFRWTAKISMPLPPITAKTKFKASSLFTYGLNLSSQTGNPTGTDSKFVYVK
jgi:hypothetical protein